MTPRPALLALALLACNDATRELRNQLGEQLQQRLTPSDKPDTSSAPLPPELVSNKLGLYVDCVNSTRVPLYAGFRQVDAALAAGKKARAETIDPVLEEALERCVKAQREGPLLQPPMPALESSATTYLASARELAAAISAFRGGLSGAADPEATDPKTRFHAAFTRWDTARRALDEHIDAHQATVDAAVLATIERRSGKGLEWHTRDLMRAAKPYVRCLGDHDEITAKICEPFLAPLSAAHAAFRAVHDADPTAAAAVFWMPQFVKSLEDYRAAATDLRATLHDNKAAAGDIARVVRAYNDLVRDSNQLNFDAVAPPVDPPAKEP